MRTSQKTRFHAFLFSIPFAIVGSTAVANCSVDQLSLRGPWGSAKFAVEIADTGATREKGLMFVEEMPQFSGMLFMYPRPQRVSFWMKNTLIPLDMLFIDETGTVKTLHENAIPHDLTPIFGGRAILAVLELNGGTSALLGIKEGAQIQHPSFDQDKAAYPCD